MKEENSEQVMSG